MLPLLAEQCGSRLEQVTGRDPAGPGAHFRFLLQLEAITANPGEAHG